MRSRSAFFIILLFVFMLSAPFATVSAALMAQSSKQYANVFLKVQHDRIDRYWIPQGKEHTVNILTQVWVYDIVDHVELWFWMPNTLDVTDWETNILEAVPIGFDGTFTGPDYNGEGWYLCVLSPDGEYFTFDDLITLEFTITIPSTLSPLPPEDPYPLLKFYGVLTGDFEGEDTMPSGASRENPHTLFFNIEPFIYPVDTPVSFSEPDTTGVKFTFDVSPKLVQIPFGVEQTWNIEAEFEVLVDDKIEWVWFMPHLISTGFDPVPMPLGLLYRDEWLIDNVKTVIIDKNGIRRATDGYNVNYGWGGANSNEDIDGQWSDSGYYITYSALTAATPEGSFFSKGDIIRFSFDYTLPPMAPGSTPHELIKASYVTSCEMPDWDEWYGWNPWYIDKRINVYFELGSQFIVPEIPYGSLLVVITAFVALILYARSRSQYSALGPHMHLE